MNLQDRELSMLVAIANHGTKNDVYAERVIREYRSLPLEVRIVVLTNIEKDWGTDVEVRIGAPTSNPWSLPFAHKPLFADRVDDFDLFVYTEDDTLITERNVSAFLDATDVLPESKIAGFLREERTDAGERTICTAHSAFRWDPMSVERHGSLEFARFSNDHSACFILTQSQLKRAIASGGFLVPPYEDRYDMLVTAATDPYTRCGMQKVIGISNLDDFVLSHLPNVYLGKLGVARSEFDQQVVALKEIGGGTRTPDSLVPTESRAFHARWSKSFYEPVDEDLIDVLRGKRKAVLSLGCGWGATERVLIDQGHDVVAVALDGVIAATAEACGVPVVFGSDSDVLERIAGQRFDAIYISNLLHLVEAPVEWLRSYAPALQPGGHWLVRSPNHAYIPTAVRRMARHPQVEGLGDYASTGVHLVTADRVSSWLGRVGASRSTVIAHPTPRFQTPPGSLLRPIRTRCSSSVLVVAKGRVPGR